MSVANNKGKQKQSREESADESAKWSGMDM